jgi:hypothetical protein
MDIYPNIKEETDILKGLQYIVRLRQDDVNAYNNLNNQFISGRKVGRIPSGSSDVIDGDVIGDFNVNATYAYFLIDNAGTAEWRRVAVGSW